MLLFRKLAALIFLQVPFYLLYVLTLVFVIAVFRMQDEEALQMLNISFPVVGALAAISFSWAQCRTGGFEKERARAANPRLRLKKRQWKCRRKQYDTGTNDCMMAERRIAKHLRRSSP